MQALRNSVLAVVQDVELDLEMDTSKVLCGRPPLLGTLFKGHISDPFLLQCSYIKQLFSKKRHRIRRPIKKPRNPHQPELEALIRKVEVAMMEGWLIKLRQNTLK